MMYKISQRFFSELSKGTDGVSIIEFALVLPLILLIGAGGIELTNFVLVNQKIERIASVTANNIARNTVAPSERSFEDTFSGLEEIATPFPFHASGRIILTGVIGTNQNGNVVNKIAWQRCSGSLSPVESSIGREPSDQSRWAEGAEVALPNNVRLMQNQSAIVSEVHYRYAPLIDMGGFLGIGGSRVIRQVSVFATRGQSFPYVTPSPGVPISRC
jgi:hypothetical protein